MNEQQKTPAEQALEVLEQAWAYFTAEPIKASDAPVYEDLPLAA
ncbi:hypothetical protein [Tropicibacter naphthalenivorans]|uniref:Uncharacterized protein n=1 Tax=Tropicibacter naphthalenivorans TaxID=441103 RepID=A0A0P1G8K8_9RHOB|nr:hypothetical protein [Tropicibacter naphthalenivorans]CUH77966.1 hypothetical protein TRN7648_01723 [Tropicibacter naphthalenivorans]SMC94806.1 hypothetical protein SAMN04488093_107119 [Tropicibacter naphthalenivorans]